MERIAESNDVIEEWRNKGTGGGSVLEIGEDVCHGGFAKKKVPKEADSKVDEGTQSKGDAHR